MEILPTKPLLKYFKIFGLFGYKDLSVSFEGHIKIVAAENGAGKTTLLNAMYYVLAGKIEKLSAIKFQYIELLFEGDKTPLRINKSDLDLGPVQVDQVLASPSLRGLSPYIENTKSLLPLLEAVHEGNFEGIRNLAAYREIFTKSPFGFEEIVDRLERAIPTMVSGLPKLAKLKDTIARKLGNLRVLYLPTYRRIEANPSESRREPTRRPHEKTEKGSKSDTLIYFGLTDIEAKLEQLTDGIRQRTFSGYVETSARTVDALLSASAGEEQSATSNAELDISIIELMLARIGKKSDELVIKRLRQLVETGAIYSDQNRGLRHFLQSLSGIYQTQRADEELIENFVKVVNEYWESSIDKKEFSYDKLQAKVSLKNSFSPTDDGIPMDSLSSGEKQIVSLFARLCLDRADYIIMIDEPELSLSIEWQRRLLPDIVKTEACKGLLAITHSPFVFQNELQPYAGALELHLHKQG